MAKRTVVCNGAEDDNCMEYRLTPKTYVTELLCETDEAVESPTIAQIEAAVSKLDGKACTMVSLAGVGPETTMIIGGGSGDRYVVTLTYDNRRFFTLLNPKGPTGKLSLICGGQRGDFDAAKCADRDTMLQAVRTFATTGERDTTLRWSKA